MKKLLFLILFLPSFASALTGGTYEVTDTIVSVDCSVPEDVVGFFLDTDASSTVVVEWACSDFPLSGEVFFASLDPIVTTLPVTLYAIEYASFGLCPDYGACDVIGLGTAVFEIVSSATTTPHTNGESIGGFLMVYQFRFWLGLLGLLLTAWILKRYIFDN